MSFSTLCHLSILFGEVFAVGEFKLFRCCLFQGNDGLCIIFHNICPFSLHEKKLW